MDCTTNSDTDPELDCFEEFCGTDPSDGDSDCFVVSSETDLEDAIDAANTSAGHDYIVLRDVTITDSNPPELTDNAGLTMRQVEEASLVVSSPGSGPGTDRKALRLDGNNNLVEGLRIVNVSNGDSMITIKGDDNMVRDCDIEGSRGGASASTRATALGSRTTSSRAGWAPEATQGAASSSGSRRTR